MIPYADLLWVVFVAVQALDGAMSYVGIRAFGLWIEGNPLVAWYTAALGPALALTGAKLFAVGCGLVLYLTARYGLMALLTLFYLAFAIVPWIGVLGAPDLPL
jgi:hypothetical protein